MEKGQALRVLRGGAFNNSATNCRAAYRNNNTPDNRNNNNGVRLVRAPACEGRVSVRWDRTGAHRRSPDLFPRRRRRRPNMVSAGRSGRRGRRPAPLVIDERRNGFATISHSSFLGRDLEGRNPL